MSASPAPGLLAGDEDFDGILPPPDVRTIVEKTALFIAKNPNPAAFEEKIKQREKSDSRFAFLNEGDAYNAYYRHRVNVARKNPDAAPAPAQAVQQPTTQLQRDLVDDGRPKVPRPPPFEFLTERPIINAVDLDILRLTALFVARGGRQFTSELSARESGNYQFDFLRPNHSLFGYFNRLVEQYTKILMAPPETLAMLDRLAGHADKDSLIQGIAGLHMDDTVRVQKGRREIMKQVQDRVEWEKWEKAQVAKTEQQAEWDRIAFATIDWNDFVVAATVEFTEADSLEDLRPPMTLAAIQNMTLAQKRKAALAVEAPQLAAQMELEEDVDGAAIPEVVPVTAPQAREVERKKDVEIKRTTDGSGPMKIRKDYVPKSQRPVEKTNYTTCTVCGQSIPIDEYPEHVRIELLDPRWKEKRLQADANRSAASFVQTGADVSASLKSLAAKRSDIFAVDAEEAARRKKEDEEFKKKQRERENIAWDGHIATSATTETRFQTGANFDLQIEALHRAKGLTGTNDPTGVAVGPNLPGQAPARALPSMPQLPTYGGAGTLSAAPNTQASTYGGIGYRPTVEKNKAEGEPSGVPNAKRTKVEDKK